MRYWECFPGPSRTGSIGAGLPVWGFGDVVSPRHPGWPRADRVRLFPLGDELVVTPGRLDDQGFSDTAPHREAVPSVYARYGLTWTPTASTG